MTRFNDKKGTKEYFGETFRASSIIELNEYIKTYLKSNVICNEKFLKEISKEGYIKKGEPFRFNVEIYPHKGKGLVDEYYAFYDTPKRFSKREASIPF